MAKQKYEGRWLCPYCGAENLGRFESCEGHGNAGCGAARGKVRFYLPEDSPFITDPDLLADASSGQDWVCDHCEGANKNAHNNHKITNCVHCAEPRTEKDHTVEKRSFSNAAVPRSHADTKAPRPTREQGAAQRKATVEQRQGPPPRKAAKVLTALATSAVLALAGFLIWFFVLSTSATPLEVTAKSWSRTLVVEQVETLSGEGWNLPSNATILTQEEKYYDTVEVVSHYEERTRTVTRNVQDGTYVCGKTDLGNGFFEDKECPKMVPKDFQEPYDHPIMKDVDVYEPWYTYTYPNWSVVDRHVTQGGADTPYWATPETTNIQRSRQIDQVYTVTLSGPDGPFSQTFPLNEWEAITENGTVNGYYNRMGGLVRISPE